MSLPRQFIVKADNPQHASVIDRACAAIRALAGQDFTITLAEIRRSLSQNAAMWPALTDFAEQVDWPHTESGRWRIARMRKESWKAVMTAAFEQETEMAEGLNGGTVMVGASTREYSRKKMADFLAFLHAEGAARGVVWSRKAQDKFHEYAVNAAKAA